jgi:hypothetical protein
MKKTRYIVEIAPGEYLAPWIGDPAVTCVMNYARWFIGRKAANYAIARARMFRPYEHARVLKIEIVTEVET